MNKKNGFIQSKRRDDETLYSKLKGGWEVTEHSSGWWSETGFFFFSEDHVLEHYAMDYDYFQMSFELNSLDGDSIDLTSSSGWQHELEYLIVSDNEIKLIRPGDSGQYLVLSKIAGNSIANSRKGLQLVFYAEDNSGFAYDRTTWAFDDQYFLPLQEDCDLTSLSPTFVLPGDCTLSPDDNGSAVDFSTPRVYTVTSSDGISKDYTIQVLQPDQSVNMLLNGSVSDKGRFWSGWIGTDQPELNSYDFVNDEIHAVIGNSSNDNWRFQVGINPSGIFRLEEGASYEISFRAKASKIRDISCCIQENNDDNNGDGNNYTEYLNVASSLGTEYQKYSFSFIMRYPIDDNGTLNFRLAGNSGEVWIDDVVLKEIDPLPQTVCYEEDGEGYIQYSTCDASLNGWTWWHYYWDTNAIPANTVEVEYIKKSGSHWPAGVLFNHYDNSNLCHIQINTNGYYNIQEKYQNSNTTIVDWTYSDLINQGMNVSNKIRIEWNATTDSFDFYANDSSLASVPLSQFPSGRNGGKAGFISAVGTAEVENFPDTPADFRYKMLQPVQIP